MVGNKVEICGVDTAALPTLSHERMRQLLRQDGHAFPVPENIRK